MKYLPSLFNHRDTNLPAGGQGAVGVESRLDDTATRALLDRLPQVREARMLNNIAFALERLDRTSFFDAIAKLRLGSLDHIALELSGNPLGLQRDDLVFERSAGAQTAALSKQFK